MEGSRSTVIAFELPVQTTLSLKVYDLNGRELATLIRGNFPSGRYRVNFTAQRLASGVYIYRLSTSSGISISRKMIVLH